MNIGFDGKRATQNSTGLGNYSRYVIRLLSKFYSENNYSIYAVKSPSKEISIPETNYKYPAGGLFKSFWRSFGIVKDLKKDKIDLFHGLSNEIPYGLRKAGIASVVTIHDLIFIRYPEYFQFADRIIYKLKFKYAAVNADRVIAISEQTKRDIINYFGVSEDRIQVVYQNCDPVFYTKTSDIEKKRIRQEYNLPEKYALNVGTIEERKNLLLVVQALKDVKQLHLVVVGKKTAYADKVEEYITQNGLTSRVHFLKNVQHQDLPGIYQQAELFIYPSRFEGFGIPIIEALHSGIPVIAATGSCLEEAGGKGSVYIDPDDAQSLSEQINQLLINSEQRQAMVLAGQIHLKRFEDTKIAAEMMQLYKNTLEHAKR